jgi:hypothetical protein
MNLAGKDCDGVKHSRQGVLVHNSCLCHIIVHSVTSSSRQGVLVHNSFLCHMRRRRRIHVSWYTTVACQAMGVLQIASQRERERERDREREREHVCERSVGEYKQLLALFYYFLLFCFLT